MNKVEQLVATFQRVGPLFVGHSPTAQGSRTMDRCDDLIATLGVLRDAVEAENKEQAFEAITIFLLQSIEVFEPTATIFAVLEETKDNILSGNYEVAFASVMGVLGRMRQAKQVLSS